MKMDVIKAKHILTVYDNNLITVRNVVKEKVTSERKLYKDEAKSIFKNLKSDFSYRNFSFKRGIPKNVVSVSFNENKITLVWRFKKQPVELFFTDEKYNDVYAVPELLFKVKNDSVSVVAIKKYGLKEKVYHAPFVNQSGGVCMGSAKKMVDFNLYHLDELMKSVENAFFNSKFSHIQDLKKMHLAGRGKSVYPVELLKKSYGTVKDFLD